MSEVPMSTSLRQRDRDVFGSIFRVGGQARQKIHWTDFVQAMLALGFSYTPRSGSARTFKAPKHMGSNEMRLDEPHGSREKTLKAKDQAGLARLLNKYFDLEAIVVKMIGAAAEAVEEPQPVEEPEAVEEDEDEAFI